MSDSTKKLFREESLERLSSPEQLDQLMNVVNPRAWLPLAGLGSLVAGGLLWSIFGRLSLTVSGQGVLIYPRSVVQFQAPSDGTILKLNIQSGAVIKKGDIIGTISQPSLEQQLKQEREKLDQFIAQARASDLVRTNRLASQRENLAKQKVNIETTLRREKIVPQLRQKNLVLLDKNLKSIEARLISDRQVLPNLRQRSFLSIAQKRAGLTQNLARLKETLPELQTQLAARRKLYDQRVVSADIMLAAQRSYVDSLSQISNIESQVKEIEVEQITAERQYRDGVNQSNELANKRQEIQVQRTDIERQYSQSLNTLDELKTKLQDLESQLAKLTQEELETSFSSKNNIQEVNRKIAQLQREIQLKSQIVSDYDGKVIQLSVVPGQIVTAGSRLGSINSKGDEAKLMSVIYFADKDGQQVKPGMEVQITPSLVKRERFGGILGKVSEVTSFPVTGQDMSNIIGNQGLAESLTSSGKAPVQVFAELDTAKTKSGYKWSSSGGPDLQLSSGTTVQVQVRVGEVVPISYIIPIFKSITGIY
ncbi:NHLP bacteriocin system secretion protein [Chamaesiphon sp.]|uniref:NHLP bacteriocin system secretion protein n=1 Tax=Chamaesiphon sp. TaxID=2814140 RepID=UPI0035934FA4